MSRLIFLLWLHFKLRLLAEMSQMNIAWISEIFLLIIIFSGVKTFEMSAYLKPSFLETEKCPQLWKLDDRSYLYT